MVLKMSDISRSNNVIVIGLGCLNPTKTPTMNFLFHVTNDKEYYSKDCD